MKTIGWILIVIGALSFIGAASKGHSVFGPLFWLGLGGTLVYLKKEKDEEPPMKLPDTPESLEQMMEVRKKDTSDITIAGGLNQNYDLKFEQKEAALCLIAFFAGYNDDIMTNEIAHYIAHQSSVFFGIQNYEETLAKAMPKFYDPDKLIDTVITIRDIKSIEFLLLSCYDLTKLSGKDEAYELLYNIANDLGYNKDKLNRLINQYSKK